MTQDNCDLGVSSWASLSVGGGMGAGVGSHRSDGSICASVSQVLPWLLHGREMELWQQSLASPRGLGISTCVQLPVPPGHCPLPP